jgi:hypothetical protein
VVDGDAAVAVAMEHFWQNFPKAIAVDGRAIELHLFPPQDLDLHEIQAAYLGIVFRARRRPYQRA